MQAIVALAILGAVVVLLVLERPRPDVVAMAALATLMLTGLVEPRAALTGFSNPATITVACMFLLSAGLEMTGVVRWIADRVLRLGPMREIGLLLLLLVVVAPLSAIVNNTAAVAVFLPVTIRVCRANGIGPGRILMPMAFLAILGGTCTLIGTSTNILVSSLAAERGLAPFGMFEFAPVGLIWLAIGAVYLLLIGRRLLPDRNRGESLSDAYDLGDYLSELRVGESSPLVGQTLDEVGLGARLGVQVLGIGRNESGGIHAVPVEGHAFSAGDILLVKAPPEALLAHRKALGIEIRTGSRPGDAHLTSIDSVLVEAVVATASTLDGQSIRDVDFRRRYSATVLALRRHGHTILEKVGRLTLRTGDELLIVAHPTAVERLRRSRDVVLLQQGDVPVRRPVRALLAMGIVVGVVSGAALGAFPVVVGALGGAVLTVVLGCVPLRRVYSVIDWKVIVLLAGIIPLGRALESSGGAEIVIRGLLAVVGDGSPRVLLAGLVVVTYALTGFMSNAATATVMVPLALGGAEELGVDPRPFLVAITFAASAAFYTPVGYQTNLLVYGPGGYRFGDYTRVGAPLNVLYAVASPLVIPLFFPF